MGWSCVLDAHVFYKQGVGKKERKKTSPNSLTMPHGVTQKMSFPLFLCLLFPAWKVGALPYSQRSDEVSPSLWLGSEVRGRWVVLRMTHDRGGHTWACTDQVAPLPSVSFCPSSQTMLLLTQKLKSFLAAIAWRVILSPNLQSLPHTSVA